MQAQCSSRGQRSPLALSLPTQPRKAPSDTLGTPLLPWQSQARRLRERGGEAGAGLSLGARRLGVLPFSLLGVGRRRVQHSLVPFHLHDALGIQVQLCKATRRGAVARASAPPSSRHAGAARPPPAPPGARGWSGGGGPGGSSSLQPGQNAGGCRPRPEVPPDPAHLSCSWAGPWRQLSPWCPTSSPLPGAAGGRPRSAPAAAATRRSASVHAGPGARAEGRGRRGRRQREGEREGRRGGGGSGAGEGGGGAAPAASLLSRGPRRRWLPTGSLAEPLPPPPPCQSPPPSSAASSSSRRAAGSAGAQAGGERAGKGGGAGERRKHPSAFGPAGWGDSLSPRPILGRALLPREQARRDARCAGRRRWLRERRAPCSTAPSCLLQVCAATAETPACPTVHPVSLGQGKEKPQSATEKNVMAWGDGFLTKYARRRMTWVRRAWRPGSGAAPGGDGARSPARVPACMSPPWLSRAGYLQSTRATGAVLLSQAATSASPNAAGQGSGQFSIGESVTNGGVLSSNWEFWGWLSFQWASQERVLVKNAIDLFSKCPVKTFSPQKCFSSFSKISSKESILIIDAAHWQESQCKTATLVAFSLRKTGSNPNGIILSTLGLDHCRENGLNNQWWIDSCTEKQQTFQTEVETMEGGLEDQPLPGCQHTNQKGPAKRLRGMFLEEAWLSQMVTTYRNAERKWDTHLAQQKRKVTKQSWASGERQQK